MCGIAGYIDIHGSDVRPEYLKQMMANMKHRGPDDEGIYIDRNVGLGFVRLSILDLSIAGHQPMFSEDNKFVIVYNGEVYNYLEIRNKLKNKYHFKSGTDTEVVLAAYQEWGENCLDQFNGMFAFIIFNTETREIFGARDRFGIKPLYIYNDCNRFIFASEIKSILPLINAEENNNVIYSYLLYNRIDYNEETFFKNIRKLPPGNTFKFTNGEIKFKEWYSIKDKVTSESLFTPVQFHELFKDSLKLRLRSDVPIGVSLSGGIDSSSIASSLFYDFDLKNVNTFSGVFGKSETSDESNYIAEFKSLFSNMHFINPDEDSFFADIGNFIYAHNEPVPDTGPYVQYKVMELASKYVKVTLDGQGADEYLAGYHYFFGSYYRELLVDLRFDLLLSEIFHYINKHKSFTGLKYLLYYFLPFGIQESINSKVFPSINQQFIYENKNDCVNKRLLGPKSLNDSLLQHINYKLEHLLKWEDLNSMNFSIESRVPFLDHRLVEKSLSTPPMQKIYKGETKHLLRNALSGILPAKIKKRKDKKGFSSPRDKWLRSQVINSYINELLVSTSFKNRGYFDSEIAQSQYRKHCQERGDYSQEIWKWINLECWFRRFIDK